MQGWHSYDRDDVIAGSSGRITLRDRNNVTVAETRMDTSGRYTVTVAPGVYEIQLLDPHTFIQNRRARVRFSPDQHSTVNLYPVSRGGWTLTVHGDRRETDPQIAYDDYRPDEKDPDLNLVVQYRNRRETGGQIEYEGPYLMLSFDWISISAHTLTLDPATLKVTSKDHAFVDLGQTRIRVESVELNSRERIVHVVTLEETRDIHF